MTADSEKSYFVVPRTAASASVLRVLRNPVNIIIIGAGTIGYSLAEYLGERREHQIAVIDSDSDLCTEINATLDVFTVNALGSSPAALVEAGIERADMVIAVTPSDETNLLACYFAKQYGVAHRIARIKSSEFTRGDTRIDLTELGVTRLIEPEREVVKSIIQFVELPGTTEAANFQSDNVYLRGYRITASMPVAGKTLAEIRLMEDSASILIVLIVRQGKGVLPSGDQYLLPDDEVVAIMPRESIEAFRRLMGKDDGRADKAIISGDTLTAVHLADALKKHVKRVLLVDPNEEHGKQAASRLDDVEVLHGDCTNTDLLQEIGIASADFFIAVDSDTEDNVMSCLLAKAEGAKEVIALNQSDRHARLFQNLGLDHIVNPRSITAQAIISDILRVPISAHLGVRTTDVNILHLIAGSESRVLNKPLKELGDTFKKSMVLGAIMRGDTVIIPRGDTEIHEGDEVIVLTRKENIRLAHKIFGLPG